MTEPTESERAELNKRLARRQGYHTMSQIFADSTLWFLCAPDGARISNACGDSEEDCWQDAPDFTRDLAASRELVLWLASTKDYKTQCRFGTTLEDQFDDWKPVVLAALIADPLLIAIAADAATKGEE